MKTFALKLIFPTAILKMSSKQFLRRTTRPHKPVENSAEAWSFLKPAERKPEKTNSINISEDEKEPAEALVSYYIMPLLSSNIYNLEKNL